MTTLEIDALAKDLGDRFQAADRELYLVGGVVRDTITGRAAADSPDTDFATDATLEFAELQVTPLKLGMRAPFSSLTVE